MTDVNIATELLTDAFQDRFDTAMLISGDSDLTSPIRTVRQVFPEKRVVVAFPPERQSVELAKAASTSFHIGRAKSRTVNCPIRSSSRMGTFSNGPQSGNERPKVLNHH